mmetsp:Transcript_120215/g.347414  ORF Transcript_120215/g.347414 Transcript_120215/m.347414 type:complete len:191 (+) Transcript_120215:46-618(+)|eukprot:CAMPEP_0176085146 /NCGR_PEP_ID=MMETSP0120_2-20121206/42614_1 /TAXON_ID=160619 /ORGANISM="Kryptoperidinium foliaceum, Strain CCMP 1326" /LENGTH=190 /DNA_ID=CAMNT_0017418961 /DNA_START=36 /DNA_END=608 /DNA_ORIENTATION=-
MPQFQTMVLRNGFWDVHSCEPARRSGSAPPAPGRRHPIVVPKATALQLRRLDGIVQGEPPQFVASATANIADRQAQDSSEKYPSPEARRRCTARRCRRHRARAAEQRTTWPHGEIIGNQKKSRPCKAKRERMKMAISRMEVYVSTNPDALISGRVTLPATITSSPNRMARVMDQLSQAALHGVDRRDADP